MAVAAKQCITCLVIKPLVDFGRRTGTSDGLQAKCRACIADYQRWQRQRKAIAVYGYLLEHPCVDCGESDPIVLDFDHVRGVKKADVKRMTAGSHASLTQVMAEIAKCEVRCANCHRRATAARGGMHAWMTAAAPKPVLRSRRVENACGTRTGYKRGCRCDACREAQRVYCADWARRDRNKNASVA